MRIIINEKTISGVIFDIDGVLLDSMAIWKNLGARYLETIGIRPEEGLGETLFSMSMEEGADYLKEQYNVPKSREEIISGIEELLKDFYYSEVLLKPGAMELVAFFRWLAIPVTAATSSPREHVTKALERNGMIRYIDRIFTNSEIGESKHSKKIYDIASQSMGTVPEETLVFEDSLYALKTAKAAGYITAGVFDPNGESDQEGMKKEADIYLLSFSEIFRYIRNKGGGFENSSDDSRQ